MILWCWDKTLLYLLQHLSSQCKTDSVCSLLLMHYFDSVVKYLLNGRSPSKDRMISVRFCVDCRTFKSILSSMSLLTYIRDDEIIIDCMYWVFLKASAESIFVCDLQDISFFIFHLLPEKVTQLLSWKWFQFRKLEQDGGRWKWTGIWHCIDFLTGNFANFQKKNLFNHMLYSNLK